MADVGNREHLLCAEAKQLESSVPLCKLVYPSPQEPQLWREDAPSPSTLLH